jgi:thiol-disulfide isomerase/thioredoxin
MRKIAILGSVLTIAIGLTLFFVRQTHSTDGSQVYSEIQKLNINHFDRLKGEYFLIHFWAKWCEPCIEEIQDLIQFADLIQKKQLPDGKPLEMARSLQFLAVSLDPTLEEALTILPNEGKNLPANFLLALDSEQKFAGVIGSYQYPETYLVDPTGQILEKWIGVQKWLQPQVFEYFKQKIR